MKQQTFVVREYHDPLQSYRAERQAEADRLALEAHRFSESLIRRAFPANCEKGRQALARLRDMLAAEGQGARHIH